MKIQNSAVCLVLLFLVSAGAQIFAQQTAKKNVNPETKKSIEQFEKTFLKSSYVKVSRGLVAFNPIDFSDCQVIYNYRVIGVSEGDNPQFEKIRFGLNLADVDASSIEIESDKADLYVLESLLDSDRIYGFSRVDGKTIIKFSTGQKFGIVTNYGKANNGFFPVGKNKDANVLKDAFVAAVNQCQMPS